MVKKAQPKKSEVPAQKLFYVFYNQERWDNWISQLSDCSFESQDDEEAPSQGMRILESFSEDITISVLKIIRLYQNQRFSQEETLERLATVEEIIMRSGNCDDLAEIIEILQLSKLVLFGGCRKYLAGNFEKEIKSLVKRGRAAVESDLEQALDSATSIAASVIDGSPCCSKYIQDDSENPTIFDEWLFECERMKEALTSLKNFDEVPGEEV